MESAKEAIIEELNKETNRLMVWFTNIDAAKIESGPEGAWTAGQHLLHLIKSTKPLAVGLGYPKVILRLRFGTTKNGSGTSEELIKRYQNALNNGGVASGEYIPRAVMAAEKQLLMSRFKMEVDKLMTNLKKWPEVCLDTIVVPHPLIGKITLREMLYFTIYHISHHAKILEDRY
ncbi:DinB family protein [Bacteroidota bacterium]